MEFSICRNYFLNSFAFFNLSADKCMPHNLALVI